MTLPASGTITLAQVNTELGRSATASINMNESAVRTLFGKPSGAISMSDGWGKSSYNPTFAFNPNPITVLNQPYSTANNIITHTATFTLNGSILLDGGYSQLYLNPVGNSVANAYAVRFVASGADSMNVFGTVRSGAYDTGYVNIASSQAIAFTSDDQNSVFSAVGTLYIRRNSDSAVISSACNWSWGDQ